MKEKIDIKEEVLSQGEFLVSYTRTDEYSKKSNTTTIDITIYDELLKLLKNLNRIIEKYLD